MAIHDELTAELPAAWRAVARINEQGRLAVGAHVFGRLMDPLDATRIRIGLFGGDLGLEFRRQHNAWTLHLTGWLGRGIAPDAVSLETGAGDTVRLGLPQRELATVGGRLRAVWTDAELRAAVLLRADDTASLLLEAEAAAAAQIRIELAGITTGTADEAVQLQFELPWRTPGYLIGGKVELEAGFSTTLATMGTGRVTLRGSDFAQKLAADVRVAEAVTLPRIGTDMLGGAGRFNGDVRLIVSEAGVRAEGISLEFESAALRLGNGILTATHDLRVAAGDAFLRFDVEGEAALPQAASSPFTCVIAEGAAVGLSLSPTGWRLDLIGGDAAAARIYVPGGTKDQLRAASDRFVLALLQEDEAAPALSIGTGGVSLRAVARPLPIRISGLQHAEVTGGELVVQGSDWRLAVSAAANLPWFHGASGRVDIQGARTAAGASFGATLEVPVSDNWTDPTGTLAVRDAVVNATLGWENGVWKLGGSLSGTLVLRRMPFDGDAALWLQGVFADLAVQFERFDLSQLHRLARGGRLLLHLAQPVTTSLWDVFHCRLDAIELSGIGRLGLRGDVGFSLGAVTFGGRLAGLGVKLEGGRIGLHPEALPSLSGYLTAPSGVRVQMSFERERGERVEMLSGRGSITGPAMPDVDAMIRVGRFRRGESWQPSIAVNARVPVNKPIFPGVVVKSLGVGFGVHQTLRGVGVTTAEDAFRLLAAGALPQPGDPASWQVDEETAFSLVAQVIIGASVAPPETIDYYVADFVMSLDTRLRLAGFGQLWMFTRPSDIGAPEFRRAPFSRGLLVIDASQPSLLAAYESVPNPKMSLAVQAGPAGAVLGGLLGAVRTRASLEARPGLFDLTLGPNEANFRVGPFRAEARTLLGIRASRAGAYAIAAGSMSAGFSAAARLSVGPATVGIEASAGFGVAVTLYGGIEKGRLMLAADVRADAHASLAIRLEIRFRVRIKAGFVRITINFSKHWTFSFELQLNVSATLVIATAGVAFQGHAAAEFKVMGIGVRARLPVRAGEASLLEDAESAMKHARQGALSSGKS